MNALASHLDATMQKSERIKDTWLISAYIENSRYIYYGIRGVLDFGSTPIW